MIGKKHATWRANAIYATRQPICWASKCLAICWKKGWKRWACRLMMWKAERC